MIVGLRGRNGSGGRFVTPSDSLAMLAADAMKQTRLLVNNPREVAYDDAFAIYSEALDGKLRRAA